jgi:cell division protein FtsI (penicillin-binding protein 3)
LSNNLPQVKSGNKRDITALLKMLKVNYQLNYEGEWLIADTLAKKVQLDRKKIDKNLVPNVIGMTAKDAVYLLENRGLIVKLIGYGKVTSQSLNAGIPFGKGQLIKIELKQ